jgi:nucleotide-binding universal stress UspA family protein/predicted transcriptional regulator
MLRTVLVPLDGSELSEASLPWAVRLARERGLSVTLARVTEYPFVMGEPWVGGGVGSDVYAEVLEADRAGASAYLNQVRKRLAEPGITIDTVVRTGTPGVELPDLAAELGAAVLVMASHGRGGFKRLVLGSVAMQLLSHVEVPILLMRPSEADPGAPPSFHRLMVPLDGSLLAERAIDLAREFASPGATLVLVRVVPSAEAILGDGPAERIEADEATAYRVTRARGYLERIAKALTSDGVSVETQLLVSDSRATVGHQLIVAAMAANVAAVVMATHAPDGFSLWLPGSVADEVVRGLDRPVLVANARVLAARTAGQVCVGDVMTRDVMAVGKDEPLLVALRKLVRRGASGAPVLNADGTVVGVVSQRDLLDWQERVVDALTRASAPTPSEYARRLRAERVSAVMSSPPATIAESATLGAALAIMRQAGVHRLPVISDGRLVGIVTGSDVLRALLARLEASEIGDLSAPVSDGREPASTVTS